MRAPAVHLIHFVACGLMLGAAIPSCGRHTKKPFDPPTSASPVVRGAESGLELWWWVVTDQRPVQEFGPVLPVKPGETPPPRPYRTAEPGVSIEKALTPYLERPVPFSAEQKAAWKAHGLRVVCVPIKDLDALQASLRLTGPVHRQWFGHLSQWTDIVRGPEFSSPLVIMVGEKPEELRPGRLRLMARCWTYPVTASAGAPGAGVRLELVPQFEPGPTERSRLQVATGRSDDQGLMFTQLAAGLSIDRLRTEPDAILIVPDRPEADWNVPAAAVEEEDGPEVDTPPSLGEAMLAASASRSSAGVTPRARAVVILIPRLPERFELLGR